jgi:molecular chaperone GrpE
VHEHETQTQQAAAPGTPAPPAPAREDPAVPAAEAQPEAGAAGQTPQPQAEAEPEAAEAPAGAAAAGSDGDPAALRERAAKADEYLALAQRTQADFENFRKRMARDVRSAEARGMSRLAKELLPALDNLDRAIAAVEASDDEDEHHLTKGIRLVQSELSSALARTGIEAYAAKGERFDPVHHEAVAQTPVEGAEPGSIVEVLQSGYRLNELVLRPARVIVAG